MKIEESAIAKEDFDPNQGIGNPNTTPIPDQFLDKIAPFLSGSEVKIMLYIFRRTFGFKKDQDTIAYSQFLYGIVKKDGIRLDNGAGVSERSLIRGLDTLTERGLIFRHQQFREDGGKEVTLYEVNRDGRPHFEMEKPQNGRKPPSSKMPEAPIQQNAGSPSSKKDDTLSSKMRDTRNSIKQQTVVQHTEVISSQGAAANVCVSDIKADNQSGEEGEVSHTNLTEKRDSANKQVKVSGDTSSKVDEALIVEIKQLGIAHKKAEQLLKLARNNERSDQQVRGWIDQSRSKNLPAGYFITLVRDNADLQAPESRYKAAYALANSKMELDSPDVNQPAPTPEIEPEFDPDSDQAELPEEPEIHVRTRYAIRKSYQEFRQDKYAEARIHGFENGKAIVKVMGGFRPDPQQWLPFAQRYDPSIQEIELKL